MKKLLFFLVLLLNGCLSQQQIQAKHQAEQAKIQSQQAQITQNNNNTCLSYGFKAGTDAFANCMMNLNRPPVMCFRPAGAPMTICK